MTALIVYVLTILAAAITAIGDMDAVSTVMVSIWNLVVMRLPQLVRCSRCAREFLASPAHKFIPLRMVELMQSACLLFPIQLKIALSSRSGYVA
jgi:hypothetical protein